MTASYEAETLAHWIANSLTDSNGSPAPLADATSGLGYLEGAHQTALLLGKSDVWAEVAQILVRDGVLLPQHRRYVPEVGARMTAPIGTDLPGRCTRCGLEPRIHGHRAQLRDGTPTGCQWSGELGLLLAEQLKSEAFDNLDKADTTDENTLLRREIVALGRRQPRFTPDDLPADIRQRTNPNRRGRVFSGLLSEGVLVEVDRRKSANPKAHGKTVGVYTLGAAA
jgi:hypothetical protein